MPDTVSVHGNLHGLGFGISMVSWVLLLYVVLTCTWLYTSALLRRIAA
jgi:hypothetical protein